jgi:hypothetical protein
MGQPVSEEHPRRKFVDGIENFTGDAQAAAWPHPAPAFDAGTAVNDGMFLHQNSAPRKHLKIKTLRFEQKS